MLRRASILAVLLVSTVAFAAEKEGVKLPDTSSVAGKTLVLNGLGLREATIFNVNVYVAGLYLEEKSGSAEAIIASDGKAKRLDLVFVRDVDKGDIIEAWNDGFKNNGTDPAKLGPRVQTLYSWMGDVKDGDTLTFVYAPDKGLTVTVRGKEKGTVAGADFARAFFSIWLGPKPPNKGLKRGMLGQ